MTKIAFVFPGQGSQAVGMMREMAESSAVVRETLQQADDLLGFSLSSMMFEGAEDTLNDTANTQPALFVAGVAALRALYDRVPDARPVCVAGHSLGELTALYAAGAVSYEDGLRLVRERGRLMKQAGETMPGAMAAILGLDTATVHDVCARARAETGAILVLANDNCPGQCVISGEVAALERGIVLAKEAGARRAVRLAVSIASHSPLMASASEAFAQAVDSVTISTPTIPIVGNVEAAFLTDAPAIRDELRRQLTETVRWTEAVRAMIAYGADTFIEFGSKDVLTGLLKRIDGTRQGFVANDSASLESIVQNLQF